MHKRWKPLDRAGLAKQIGGELRRHREARGWPQELVATLLEVPRDWVARYEAGDLLPPTYTLYQIAGVFAVAVGGLIEPGQPTEAKPSPQLAEVWKQLERLPAEEQQVFADHLATTLAGMGKLRGLRW